jgi:transcription elongation GreA/GreB family factor
MADLFAALERLQIYPLGDADGATTYVDHRTVSSADGRDVSLQTTQRNGAAETDTFAKLAKSTGGANGVRPGDRVVIRHLDDNKTATFTLSGEHNDPSNGLLSVTSPLGKQLVGLVEEDETEFEVDGHIRRVLIVRAERQGHFALTG